MSRSQLVRDPVADPFVSRYLATRPENSRLQTGSPPSSRSTGTPLATPAGQ